MQKLITGLAAAAALGLLASAGQACEFHATHVSASIAAPEEGVAMSTHDDATTPTLLEQAAETAATANCAPGATDCTPSSE